MQNAVYMGNQSNKQLKKGKLRK